MKEQPSLQTKPWKKTDWKKREVIRSSGSVNPCNSTAFSRVCQFSLVEERPRDLILFCWALIIANVIKND